MEHPATWNRATASLACFGADHAEEAWAFLVDDGLVNDRPGDRDAFLEMVREEDHEITGPSRAARVAGRMERAGLLRGEATAPDPEGNQARQRVEAWRARRVS
jgi:hypothetical protein